MPYLCVRVCVCVCERVCLHRTSRDVCVCVYVIGVRYFNGTVYAGQGLLWRPIVKASFRKPGHRAMLVEFNTKTFH